MPNKDVPLDFPSKGLSVTREYGQQPDLTTADCSNVASRDSIAGRDRGGSRTGFSKYIAAQSTDGAVKIQMLDVIVDPTSDALPQNFNTPDDTWIPHPRFPDILIPPGGAPWQPNPNAEQPSTAIAHVQSKRSKFSGAATEQSIAFASSVANNNTLIVVVATTIEATSGLDVTVKNNAGTAYTQVGGYVEILDPRTADSYVRLSMWGRTVSAGASDNTVKVNPAAAVVTMVVTQLEYSGMPTSAQNDGNVTLADSTNPPSAPAVTGNIPVLADAEMILAAFSTILDSSGFTPGTGYTLRPNEDDGSDFDLRLNVIEKIGVNNPADNPTVASGTTTGGEDPYVSIGSSWKKR